MPASLPLRTPGLYFETQAPEPREILPRLDIAAFVGFAASGPIGVPVAIEDPVTFHELFGADVMLGGSGWEMRAELGPAVRAFFHNGGRRCWVVRVAGEAVTNTFVLPGLLAVRRPRSSAAWAPEVMTRTPGVARARSAGSWSDAIAVNTTLESLPLPRGAVLAGPVDSPSIDRTFSIALDTGTSALRPGELLRLDLDSGPVAFVIVPADPIPDSSGRIQVGWSEALWIDEADEEPWPFEPASIRAARRLAPSGSGERVVVFSASRADGSLKLGVVADGARPLREGDWIELDVVATGSGIAQTWLLHVDRTSPAAPAGSPVPDGDGLEIDAGRAWRFVDPPAGLPPGATIQARALTFELWTRDQRGRTVRLGDLGFVKGHPRYWGDLPSDEDLFTAPELALGDQRALARAVSQPRLPLAGPAPDRDPHPLAFLPLGMTADARREREVRAEASSEPREVRDGLDRIDAGLFLDPALRDASPDDLIDRAFRARYGTDGRTTRALRGLHALIDVDEISLIAAPDALLGQPAARRQRATPSGVRLAATLSEARVALDWPAAPGAIAYTLEQSDAADFATVSRSERLVPRQSDVLVIDDPPGHCTRHLERPAGTCAGDRFYRVRVEGLSGAGPWSNTMRVRPVAASFEPCARIGAAAPVLSVTRSSGHVTATWTATGAARYRLESALDPSFAAAHVLVEAPATTASMLAPLTLQYLRVRAATEPPGAWSNTVPLEPDADVTSPSGSPVTLDPGTALEVNAALLTFCAARGDVFAVLGAPAALSEAEVLQHKTDLVAPFLARDDRRTPSFGALYDPWLVVVQDGIGGGGPHTVSPAATICGLIAARTLSLGAWFAPANRRLAGVVSRSRAVDAVSWARLAAAQINAVSLQPHGYVTLSAHTLTPDPDLRQISVRRLMILLRRLVLREGPSLVFEPNDAALRRSVRRQFEGLLGQLFARGAFAGRTSATAFQVVVDETINPPQSVDRGRLMVELRVAPSRPLTFLIVRFVLSGSGAAAMEGA